MFGFYKDIKGYKFMFVGVELLAFNILLYIKSKQKVYTDNLRKSVKKNFQ